MGRKRPERTARRSQERAARQLVRDKEKLAELVAGGAADHPIDVTSSSVVEVRARSLLCPQCEGHYKINDHRSTGQGVRAVDVTCQRCGVARTLWFRIVSADPN